MAVLKEDSASIPGYNWSSAFPSPSITTKMYMPGFGINTPVKSKYRL
ncbi:hypothetical protein DCCM_4758 [Desulfocucumis palustris]|uniref:Uncharacterized protein n=1 Tax=Desulfocucumis palustris TaxID=1898651 RepID=A0A2L2XGY5_9FIRM|nr:hypothetical protein DCCM_4758 [Desulfocucumis palustris]